MTLTCRERIYPPGLAGIGSAHYCDCKAKSNNKDGQPRCGKHTDEAKQKRAEKSDAAYRKAREQERTQRETPIRIERERCATIVEVFAMQCEQGSTLRSKLNEIINQIRNPAGE